MASSGARTVAELAGRGGEGEDRCAAATLFLGWPLGAWTPDRLKKAPGGLGVNRTLLVFKGVGAQSDQHARFSVSGKLPESMGLGIPVIVCVPKEWRTIGHTKRSR